MSDTTRCQRTNTCGNGKQVASPTKGTPTNPQISSFPQTLRDSSSPEELQGGNDHFLRSGGEMQDPMNDLWQTSSTLRGPNTIPRQLIAKDPPRPPSRAPARPSGLGALVADLVVVQVDTCHRGVVCQGVGQRLPGAGTCQSPTKDLTCQQKSRPHQWLLS